MIDKNASIFAFQVTTAAHWGFYALKSLITRDPSSDFIGSIVSYVVAIPLAFLIIWVFKL